MKHDNKMAGQYVSASWLIALFAVLPVSGCISLEAPNEPIVIELNINISQEVVYRLDNDAKALIDENEDIF
ncbi:YnbE family lipoprotein [Alterisphingorhabdus coralli]|uniref:YnbE family lipoprotein n=1 Tax=Alterisphingorhabdus coralli TaxID=3071408 RepID=A0AA97HYT5_9SPHN|nr:YnbE family lipoprotein [Parasphingorhabdus sp. SCSIO 66989]WOE73849.1 YnbE family lipoprotein [Parasphingorhabdus sp. SCSIO 66989]